MSGYIYNNNIKFKSYGIFMVHYHRYSSRLFGRKIMRGGGFGVIINLILGIAGGVLGGWVFGLLGIAASGIIGSLITATVGAILMLWIASLFNKRNVD